MDYDKSVEFLYKTMMERDPHKRRVKPVQPHLLQLELAALGSSSDDSDFKVNSDEEDDEDKNSKESDDDNSDDEDSDDESKSKSDESSSELLEDGEKDDEISVKSKCSHEEKKQEMDSLMAIVPKKFNIQICSVCLGDSSKSDDEIIECDGCFVTVHEGCYGSVDVQSVASSSSSSSTEPWFCDSCKAGIQPYCELCPNTGGIFKETETGRWVHLVCALYTPGVAFGDVDRLNNVTLFEMSYAKYGVKECSLCDDIRFNRVGVCISCDAGLCKVNFHVTCAQKFGYLSEASLNEDVADPFFAHCKQHADKMQVKQLRKNWLTLQSQVKENQSSKIINDRIRSKLFKHQSRYKFSRMNGKQGWIPKEKLPRMLLSSGYVLKQLLRKAELLGLDKHVECNNPETTFSRKKGFVPPSFHSDFFNYYIERNDQIVSMEQNIKELTKLKVSLENEERQLNLKYEKLQKEITELNDSSIKVKETGLKMWELLTEIYGKRIRVPDSVSFKDVIKSPAVKTSPQKLSPIANLRHKCITCQKNNNQHMLVKCDRCQKFQHLYCLDPPLTKMPKKSKLQEWHCSSCNENETISGDDEETTIDPNQPRQLRNKQSIKQPIKYNISKKPSPKNFNKENQINLRKSPKKRIGKKRKLSSPAKSPKADNKIETVLEVKKDIYEISSDDSDAPISKNPRIEPSINQSTPKRVPSSSRTLLSKRPSILSKSPIRKSNTSSPVAYRSEASNNHDALKTIVPLVPKLLVTKDSPLKYIIKNGKEPLSISVAASNKQSPLIVQTSSMNLSLIAKADSKPKQVIILAGSRNLNKEFVDKNLEEKIDSRNRETTLIGINNKCVGGNGEFNLNISTSTEEDTNIPT